MGNESLVPLFTQKNIDNSTRDFFYSINQGVDKHKTSYVALLVQYN